MRRPCAKTRSGVVRDGFGEGESSARWSVRVGDIVSSSPSLQPFCKLRVVWSSWVFVAEPA